MYAWSTSPTSSCKELMYSIYGVECAPRTPCVSWVGTLEEGSIMARVRGREVPSFSVWLWNGVRSTLHSSTRNPTLHTALANHKV